MSSEQDFTLLARSIDEASARFADGIRLARKTESVGVDTAQIVREMRQAVAKASGDGEAVAAAIDRAALLLAETVQRKPARIDVVRDDMGLIDHLIVTRL